MKRVLFFYLMGIMMISFIIMTLISSTKDNPIKIINKIDNNYFKMALPQGWAFFTKNPKDPQIYIYELDNSELKKLNFKNVQIKQYFGLNKSNRYIHFKIGGVLNEIPPSHWYTFTRDINLLNIDSLNSYRIKKEISSELDLKDGNYIIEMRKPIPWVLFSKVRNLEELNLESYYILMKIDNGHSKN